MKETSLFNKQHQEESFSQTPCSVAWEP